MKNLLVLACAAGLAIAVSHVSAQGTAGNGGQVAQARALFDANKLESGRIVVLINERADDKGQTSAGVQGFRKMDKKRWRKDDFAGVRRVAVFEKHPDGSITTRDAEMVKDGRIIFADSGQGKTAARQSRPASGGASEPDSAETADATEQIQSVVISGEDRVEAEEAPVQVVQENIVIDTGEEGESGEVVYSEKVRDYREQKALEVAEGGQEAEVVVHLTDVDLVVSGGEEEALGWEPIEIEGEKACQELSSDETWFNTLSRVESGCAEDDEPYFASCAARYPATTTATAAFIHVLTGDCYSCPKDYLRSLNPDIKADDACIRVIQASSEYEKASFKGPVTTPKPHKRAFKDPRNGGEWWKCPKDRPRRTLEKVTSKKACATEKIIGEKLSRAEFLGPVKNPKPAGAFTDPRNGGEYWKCPAGYDRSLSPVTEWDACVKTTPRHEDGKRAIHRGTL